MTQITSSTFVLAVTDLDRSKRFYVEQLGFQEDLSVEGWSFLSRGACKLRIGHCPGIRPMSACEDHSWFAYLHVEGTREMFADFVAKKVPIWHPLEDKPWGMREFAVVTPDGHRIVFGEELT